MSRSSRRQFLKCAGAATLGGALPFALNLSAFNAAFAADTTGYRALVCVFLYGGLDGHDVVIPYDQTSYDAWASLRAPMLADYEGNTRSRDALLPLSGVTLGGREFALAAESAPLHSLFSMGRAAVVGNVGPLLAPIDRAGFMGTAARPPRLFSHNDQQSVWMASQPEGARYGWGGRLGDMVLAASANPNTTFTAISVSGSTVFLSGEQARQFQASSTGAVTVSSADSGTFLSSAALPGILEAHLLGAGNTATNLFERDAIELNAFALEANRELGAALASVPPFATAYPAENRLAAQLNIVAQIIAQRETLGARRQIFFVSAGGFDTHSGQASALPALQGQVAQAIRAFYDTTAELGVQNDVTTFTASDFGRTLQVNGDGTDHGWGNHHFVIGGSVNGGNIFGDIPPPAFDHDQDAGRGRIIPTTAVDQYAAALGRWFGLTPSELRDALPGLSNFDADALAGLLA